MTCFVSLSWWVLHPSATLASALSRIYTPRRQSDAMHAKHSHTHTHTQIASRKLHHFPAVVWKLHLSLTIPPITPQVSFFLPSSPPSRSPCLTILSFSLHFNSAPKLPGLNCPMNSVGWTGRQEVCVNAWVSVLSPSLFIFLSKWCCQEPNKISLSARPPTGSHNTTSRKWNKRIKTKVNKMVAFQTPAPLPYPD